MTHTVGAPEIEDRWEPLAACDQSGIDAIVDLDTFAFGKTATEFECVLKSTRDYCMINDAQLEVYFLMLFNPGTDEEDYAGVSMFINFETKMWDIRFDSGYAAGIMIWDTSNTLFHAEKQ